MKKLLALTLALLMTAALLPLHLHTASAEGETSGQCGDDLYWEFDESAGTLTITGSGAMWDYAYENSPWYSLRSDITAAVLPDDLTSIGNAAFYGCSELTSVEIGDRVTSIGNISFEGCSGLSEITIPDSVISIGEGAFCNCTELISVEIGDGVSSIGNRAFIGCTSLLTIMIPDNVTNIGYMAFYDCTSLNTVTFIDRTTDISIGFNVFVNCPTVSSVTVPCSIDPGNIFYTSRNITEVHVTKGTGEWKISGETEDSCWGPFWFNSVNALQSVTLDEGIQSIGSSTFQGCTGLTEITIPNSVTAIGNMAFADCTGLTQITIPDNVTIVGDNAFAGCTGLETIDLSENKHTDKHTCDASRSPCERV